MPAADDNDILQAALSSEDIVNMPTNVLLKAILDKMQTVEKEMAEMKQRLKNVESTISRQSMLEEENPTPCMKSSKMPSVLSEPVAKLE